MDDIERLINFIHNYFPDPTFSRDDVRDYLEKEVKGWGYVPKKAQRAILKDWEMAIEEEAEGIGEPPTKKGRMARIRAFLGRLFGRGLK